ncbi:hypothetical protein Tco_0981749 [Tanacetum coccineum]
MISNLRRLTNARQQPQQAAAQSWLLRCKEKTTAAADGSAQRTKVCIGILACRGLSLVSSPLHAMKSQSQIKSSAVVNLGNSAKRQKTSEYKAYVSGESSSRQVNEEERDDDEIPSKQVSQDIMEEVSLTIDEAKLKKMAYEVLRQRCTSREEHQYHIDQMKNFLKSDIVWKVERNSYLSTSMKLHTSRSKLSKRS